MKHGIFLIAIFFLSACGTAAGIQQDFREFNASLNKKVQELTDNETPPTPLVTDAPRAALNNVCPPIIIDPELNSLTEFYDESNPSAANKVSSVRLARASSECSPDGEYVSILIELAFDSKLGPKARRKPSDQPFFAYPYFITVTDNTGAEVVKELFAASMTYDSTTTQQSLVETIRQRLPYNPDGTLPPYQIHVGFQLTESQLFYNASL